MNYQYIDIESTKDLIDGIILHRLIIHEDQSGFLVETLRTDWPDVYSQNSLHFAMQYLSITPSGVVRDQDDWHVHQFQKDRFICVSGRIVTAVFDPRQDSRTEGRLNLFVMGPANEAEMFMLVIPEETYHGFMVISKESGYLLNFPTQLYNPTDEGRVKNTQLDWNKIKSDFAV